MNMKKTFIDRSVLVPLTENQLLERSVVAGELREKQLELEEKKKNYNDDINKKIKDITPIIDEYLKQLRTKKEKKLLKVEVVKDYVNESVDYYFEGSIVDSRDMTEQDKQMEM